MQLLNRKIYFICLITLMAIFILFCFELFNLKSEQSDNARKFLFDRPVVFHDKDYFLLDGYQTETKFEYMSYCDLKKNYSVADFKKIAYRYPKLQHVSKFYSIAYEKHLMTNEADQLFRAFKVISSSSLKTFKLKTCPT